MNSNLNLPDAGYFNLGVVDCHALCSLHPALVEMLCLGVLNMLVYSFCEYVTLNSSFPSYKEVKDLCCQAWGMF